MEGIKSTINDCKFVNLQTILRDEGKLTVIQNEHFDIKRAYYLYDIPRDASRGQHAHKTLHQLLIAVNGSFNVSLNDGRGGVWECWLDDPKEGLLIVPGIWRRLSYFSDQAVCLVLASAEYDANDYIREYDAFLKFKR